MAAQGRVGLSDFGLTEDSLWGREGDFAKARSARELMRRERAGMPRSVHVPSHPFRMRTRRLRRTLEIGLLRSGGVASPQTHRSRPADTPQGGWKPPLLGHRPRAPVFVGERRALPGARTSRPAQKRSAERRPSRTGSDCVLLRRCQRAAAYRRCAFERGKMPLLLLKARFPTNLAIPDAGTGRNAHPPSQASFARSWPNSRALQSSARQGQKCRCSARETAHFTMWAPQFCVERT